MERTNSKAKLIVLMIIAVILSATVSLMMIGIDDSKTYAQENNLSYELKIKLGDQYFWVQSDSALSDTPAELTVGDNFNYSDFKNYIQNGIGYQEGNYIDKFVYEGSATECFFASNTVLNLGEEGIYIIEPKYEKEQYILAFDLNGATTDILNPQFYFYNDVLNLPEPALEGYAFDGWKYEDADFNYTTMPDMSPDVANSSARSYTLAAKFTPLSYTISFYDGNNKIEDRNVVYGEPIGELPDVVDNGYAVLGFVVENDYTNIIEDGNYEWNIAENANLYVYRSDVPIEYTINYNGNGGEVSGTLNYNVTQLPLELQYNAYREFDYFNGFKLNGNDLSGNEKDVLPEGTVGNINLVAQWKAFRTSSSNSVFVLSESYSEEYTVVNCQSMSLTAARTITIESTVKEIAFIGSYSRNVITKKIKVAARSTPLTIHLKNINMGGTNGELLDASECNNLTLHCVGNNKLHCSINITDNERPAIIQSQNLTITGERLEVLASDSYVPGSAGGFGIYAIGEHEGDNYFPSAATIEIKIDYLYVQGGNGCNGNSDHVDGADGGYAIACWGLVKIDGHPSQEVKLMSGEGGTAYSGGTDGGKVEDVIIVVEGPYIGSNGSVIGPGIQS